MKRSLLVALIVLSAALSFVVAACGGGGESVKADVTIDIKADNMRFVPVGLKSLLARP